MALSVLVIALLSFAVGAQAFVIVVMWRAIINLEANQESMISWITTTTEIVEGHQRDLDTLQGYKVVKFPSKH